MAKIQFTLDAWLKDKSQKVETRDGRLVHNIWRVKEPSYTNNRKAEVCALIDGEEDALVFFEGGRYLPSTKDTDSPFDLFIVTPEPELSEFEKAIKDLVLAIDEGELQELGVFEEKNIGEWAVKKAGELLELAKEELQEKVIHDYWKQAADRCVQAREDGKTDALKDLPRWKIADRNIISNTIDFAVPYTHDGEDHGDWVEVIVTNFVHEGENYIEISDLEKLPGFND